MHIGLSRPLAPPYPIPDVDAAFVAREAEAAGFEHILYGEHAITPTDEGLAYSVHTAGVPYFQETVVALSRVSGATSKIRFGFGVCLVPQHQPVRLAKQLACLDYYSGGRLLLGIGTGWSRQETEALGGRFERRWAQTHEIVDVMRALWTGERVEHRGEFFHFPPIRCFPTPAQAGGPPVLIGARSDKALQRVVDYGDGWMPAFVTPETIAAGPETIRQARARFAELAPLRGRDPRHISIVAILLGDITRDDVRRYEDAGADRLAISLPHCETEADAREGVARVAEEVL